VASPSEQRTALPGMPLAAQEPLASYLPQSVLNVLVENAAQRRIQPDFLTLTVSFVNLVGLAHGPVFAAEIGEPRIRREFNLLGNTVNVAARLMGRAIGNRILMTEAMTQPVSGLFDCASTGPTRLKGR
jgi:class 3 adenylate cyclase